MRLATGPPRGKGKHAKKQRKLAMGRGISDLPNELLVCILSFLDPDESARTCVLSRRWKYLWYFTFDCLDFDPQDTITLETAIRRKKFIRFMADQMHWYRIAFTASSACVFEVSATFTSRSLKRALRGLHESKLEVEQLKNRLKKYEKKKGKTLNQQKNDRYTRVCNDIEEEYVKKLAEVQREQKHIQGKRANLEGIRKAAKIDRERLSNMMRNISVENWIILTSTMDLMSLQRVQTNNLLSDKELYFSMGGNVDEEMKDRMCNNAQQFLKIEDLNPTRLYLLKNQRFTTVSLEKAAQMGFWTFSRRLWNL